MVWKALRLPISLRGYGSFDVGRFRGGNQSNAVQHGAKCVSRNMCSRDGLTRGVGGKSGDFVFHLYFPSGRMRCQRSSSYDRHAEFSSSYPFPENANRISGAGVFRVLPLKVWQQALGAICRPLS
jgi:hypothetical protein